VIKTESLPHIKYFNNKCRPETIKAITTAPIMNDDNDDATTLEEGDTMVNPQVEQQQAWAMVEVAYTH
jgi:hypothetical protein